MAATATVRMYNQNNLGDCFLLKFKQGTQESFLLIDFGSYEGNNEEREREIAKNIQATVKDKPLIIVLTHQHKDHLTGFITAEDIMSQLNISAVWLSFLDDPKGKEAKAIRKVTEKFWKKNTENKKLAKQKFGNVAEVKKMLKAREGFDLFAEQQAGGLAITNLLKWSKHKEKFLLPGQHFDLPGLPAGAVKVYVLGPPTDEAFLRKLNPGKDDAVHGLDARMQLMNMDTSVNLMGDALQVLSGNGHDLKAEENFPFNKKFTRDLKNETRPHVLKDTYLNQHTWRRIDHEWLSEMGRVSLHMDTLTNNSSLVLAFELVTLKKVLLFVGDAQIGNWKSWFNVQFKDTDMTAEELLSKTVLYKAGHHSSHNATLSDGLELMNPEELVIMIPVNADISKNRGFAMLRPGMLMGYNRKTKGRVLRSDTIFHKAGSANNFEFHFAKKETDFTPAVKVVKDKKRTSHLFIEHVVK